MASADLSRSSTSRLEEYIALNNELAGLIRAGLPLEIGLGSSATKRVADRISDRLKRGESLQDALHGEGDSLPRAYRAVIEAGLTSGRLGEAVETVTRAARAMVIVRRRLAIAAIYPAIILLLAFVLATLILPRLIESTAAIFTSGHDRPPAAITALAWLFAENPAGWLFWLPIVVLTLLWATGGLVAAIMRLPGLRRALRFYRISTFADLGAGLMAHDVPLDQAIMLAADASGDRRLSQEAQNVVGRLRAGDAPAEALQGFRSLPHFAHWMISAGAAQGTLPVTLRHVADWAERRGTAKLDWFSLIAPAALTVVLGGITVATFAGVALGPVIALLNRLAREISL